MVKTIRSTKPQIKKVIQFLKKYYLRSNLTSKERQIIKKIKEDFEKGKDSKSKYTKYGKYTRSRQLIHNKIIRKYLRMDTRTRSPDVYVLGGVAGSGKTRTLMRFIKEKAIPINNDDIKKDLVRYDKSPIKRFPLVHAAYLHREAQDIEKELVHKALKLKKDVILDRTLGNYIKNKKLLVNAKKLGYKITLLGTNLPPHIAMIRAVTRFMVNGRYVPIEVIKSKGNKTNSSVMRLAKNKKIVDRAKVYDTRDLGKPKLLYRRGYKK